MTGCKSKDPFQATQNDADGYNRHPWGQSRSEFARSFEAQEKTCSELTSATFRKPVPDGFNGDWLAWYSSGSADSNGNRYHIWYFTMLVLDKLEKIPNANPLGAFVNESHWTDALTVCADKPEDTYYFFNNNRLVLVAAEVPSGFTTRAEAAQYLASGRGGASDPDELLKSKYQYVSSEEFTVDSKSAGDHGPHTVKLFKRGNTNTRIYSVLSWWNWGQTRFLIYVPNAYYQQIGTGVNAAVLRENDEEQKRTDDIKKQSLEETKQKVQ
jgi:hypothetical protein